LFVVSGAICEAFHKLWSSKVGLLFQLIGFEVSLRLIRLIKHFELVSILIDIRLAICVETGLAIQVFKVF
jgi:hypothetical protein